MALNVCTQRPKKVRKFVRKVDPRFLTTGWFDWKWQIKNSVKDIETFERLLGIIFTDEDRSRLQETLKKFPMSITPYYMSLINVEDYKNDPVFKQSFPDPRELIIDKHDLVDPLAEEADSPVEGLIHRYPDRVLFCVSNTCAMYCRHCTRKRKVGQKDFIPTKDDILKGVEYIQNTPEIRDVILSGGDPFMLSDDYLDWILKKLRTIPHLEIIRIGTRTPVVLPFRITDSLIRVLKKYHPLWINTHFNHPREITESSKVALRKLADAGIPLGNQSVLLSGINDCSQIMKNLVHKLTQNRVRPYYLYQCDLSEGLTHFRTPVSKGIEIMENLRGHTSGFAVPTYVIDAPGGGGKIPVIPNYMISSSYNKVVLRNYEGQITTYNEPECYTNNNCDNNCEQCKLHKSLESTGTKPAEIEKMVNVFDDNKLVLPDLEVAYSTELTLL